MSAKSGFPLAVRPPSYGESSMQQGGWTIKACASDDVAALSQALGISQLTASVLVRRGYGDPEAANAFLAAEPPRHDPFLLGDMRGAVDTIRAAVASEKRICVHGDYDVDGICATALAVSSLRAVALRVAVGEVERRVVPRHLEPPLLDPVVEPGAPEHELAQPVDERLAVHERHALPVAHEVPAQRAARRLDPAVRRQLDEIGGLVLVQLVPVEQPELDRCGDHPLLEIAAVELEPVGEELDLVVLAGAVVHLRHRRPE